MTETNCCTPEKLFDVFSKMSPEDQETVRAKLAMETKSAPICPCCDPAAMMGMMTAKGMDPMAMCKAMMGKTPPEGDCFPKGNGSSENR